MPRSKLPQIMRELVGDRRAPPAADRQRVPRRRRQPPSADLLRRPRSPTSSSAPRQANEELLRACIALGGSVTGEHGIGLRQGARTCRCSTPTPISTSCTGCGGVFDPDRLMNPGKLLPSHPACGEGFRPAAAGAARRRRGCERRPPRALGRRAARAIVGPDGASDDAGRPRRRGRRRPAAALGGRGPGRSTKPRRVRGARPRRGARRRPAGQRQRPGARRPAGARRRGRSISPASTRSLEYNPDDLTVTVQAGVTAGALAAALAAHGRRCRWIRPAGARRTLGGIAATAASGPLRAALRHDARSAARRALRAGRRRRHLGRRQGGEVGDRLRRPEAAGRLARHARRPRRADAAAAPAAGSRGDRASLLAAERRRPPRTLVARDRGLDAAAEPPRVLDPGALAACRLPTAAGGAGDLDRQRGGGGARPAGRDRRDRGRGAARGWRRWGRRSGARTIARSPRRGTYAAPGRARSTSRLAADARTRSAARSAPRRPSSPRACAPLGVLRVGDRRR